MPLLIKWNKRAFNQLIIAVEYIELDSVKNSEKIKNKILLAIDSLMIHPEKFARDKYKKK